MLAFLQKKIRIFTFEARRTEKGPLHFFLNKTGHWLNKQLVLFLDLLALVVFFVPALLIRLRQSARPERKAYFFGLEHVVDKIVLRGNYFSHQGYVVHYFSFEYSGLRSPNLEANELIHFRKYLFQDVSLLFRIFSVAPSYLELYFEGNGVRQFFVGLMTSRKKTVMSCIDRGVYQFDRQINVNPFIYSWLRKKVYVKSNLILVRDPDMFEHIKVQKEYSNSKVILDYNQVQVYELDDDTFVEKNRSVPVRILFLNGFSLERSPELLVRAVPLVLEKHNNVEFIIVGARNELERKRVLDIASELQVESHVQLHKWDPGSRKYYDQAVIYVMAAKFIYCNIALLEAMERGLVPLVSDVDKADLIVNDKVNGFLLNDTKEDLASKINFLIEHEEQRMDMGKAARQTILQQYDVSNRMEIIEAELAKI